MDEQIKRANNFKNEWANRIVEWEKLHGREFSWRFNRTPYRILISEILLKRTTSTAAIRIYEQFLEEYPDIFAIKKANYIDLEIILRPIGLYRQRAQQLKKISEYFIKETEGKFPQDYDILIKAPGVGDYTASAILSFYYKVPQAIIDSNVERIINRAFKVKGKKLRQIAKILISLSEPDTYNYGMLDIGAIVCHYRSPKCVECPVKIFCSTYENNFSNF